MVGIFQDARDPHTEVAEEARRRGLEVEIVPCGGRVDWRTAGHLRRIVALRGVDVVHSHGYKADCYAFAAMWPRRGALFATSHNWPDKSAGMQLYAKADRLILRHFDGLAVVSDVVGGLLRRSGVPAGRIASVRNGVDIATFASAAPELRRERGWTGRRVIGFAGRLVPEKGGDLLLRAAARIVAAHPEVRIVFAGDGPERGAWEALAVELGIRDRVEFMGICRNMPAVYASFDIVVLPSLDEAMPMCLIEAMAAGKPVIGTNVGGVPNLVAPGVTGLLLPPGDALALRTALERLLEDPGLAHRLGVNGAARAAEAFSDTAMARSYLALYERALANFRRRSRPRTWHRLRRLWKTSESPS